MAKARVKVLEQVCDPTEAKAIVLADVRTEAAAAAKFLEDAEANAGAKALEEAKAALAMVHTDVELVAVAKAFQDKDDALDKVILDTGIEVSQKVRIRKEVSEKFPSPLYRTLPCELRAKATLRPASQLAAAAEATAESEAKKPRKE